MKRNYYVMNLTYIKMGFDKWELFYCFYCYCIIIYNEANDGEKVKFFHDKVSTQKAQSNEHNIQRGQS